MERFIKIFDRIENLLMILGFIAITAMMLLISADTLGRYILDSPITGANEFVTIYLIVAVVYLGLSNTLKKNEHISVDFIAKKFPENIQRIFAIIVNLLGLILFVVIFYESWSVTYKAFITNESFVGVVTFPLYSAYGLVPLGSLFITIRFLINIFLLIKDEKIKNSKS